MRIPLASESEMEQREKAGKAEDANSGEEILADPGRGAPPWSFSSQTLGLRVLTPLARREGNHRHNANSNHDPTIARQADIKVEIQVATDVKLWHNRLARGKYVG